VKGAAPASVGIPSSIAKDVIVLPYGSEKSLKVIRSLRSKLAAVLVEPVQSRRPELQPREFLRVLREITCEGNVGLIFDEMVTGFRIHPGGAQAYFGVEADLVTYSKIAGGGLPLSVLAGRNDFMSYLAPMAGGGRDKTVFFAGTFCKHPLSIAASHAVMSKLKEEGPKLQEGLNQRSALMVKKLNDNLKEEGIPVSFTNFGSFFSIALSESDLTPDDVNYLSCYLQDCGIYLRSGDKGGFLTTAHSDADVKAISKAFLDGLRLIFDNKNSLKK
jgi:glutamate-1-semialdehyde aminotransferase